MTVLGFLGFAAELRGLRGEAKKRAVDRVVEMCFLEPVVAPEHRDIVQRVIGIAPVSRSRSFTIPKS